MVRGRTAQANKIRGLFAEFGLLIPQRITHLSQRLPLLLEEAKDGLPGFFKELAQRLLAHLKVLDRQVDEMELQIQLWHCSNPLSRKLEKIPGIGQLTASAMVAAISDAKSFDSGRQLPRAITPKVSSLRGIRTPAKSDRLMKKLKQLCNLDLRLLRQTRSDGKAGETVVDKARFG